MQSSSRAFTLVETLAACALSALLMLAAFKIVGALARDRHTVHFPAPPSDLPALLRTDLQGATAAAFGEGGGAALTLSGPIARSPAHFPAQVTYRLETIESRPWLVRIQQLLTTPPTPATRELLAPDVRTFQVTPIRDPADDKDKPPPVPRQILLTLDAPTDAIQTALTLR